MSWADDTDKILADGLGEYTVTVKNPTATYSSSSVFPTKTGTVVETATVNIFAKQGSYVKEVNGEKKVSSHEMIFPAASSVSVDHRIYESGKTDYYEVLGVRDYEGHKQVYTKKVEGR